jgi:pyrroloquinoline quinone biosynthesis protein E
MLGGLFQQARQAYGEAGMLYHVHLDLLYQCDLDCVHCYLDDKGSHNLPTAFWQDVLEQLAAMEVFSVQLSGGEPLLRKDCLELIAHARALGLQVHLKTHGGTVDAAVARRLAELGVATVAVSYYAADPAIHDAITGRSGSHAATLAGIEHLRDAGLLVIVACAVMAANQGQVEAVARQCQALGVLLSFDGRIRAANSGDAGPTERVGLSADELAAFYAFDGAHGGGCELPTPSPGWGEGRSCVAGWLNLYVTPAGEVTPCVAWPMPVGDLRRESFRAIWERSPGLTAARAMRRADRATCSRCGLREGCDYCPGQAWMAHGDATAPTPLLCTSAHARAAAAAQALGAPPPPPPAGPTRRRFRVLTEAEVAAATAAAPAP